MEVSTQNSIINTTNNISADVITNREKIEEINSFKCIATTLFMDGSCTTEARRLMSRRNRGTNSARLLHGASDQRVCGEHCHTFGVGSQERLLAISNGRTLAWSGHVTRPLSSQRRSCRAPWRADAQRKSWMKSILDCMALSKSQLLRITADTQ